MKVEMLTTKRGSPNGIAINTYYQGDIVDLPKSLYDTFKKEKWCKDYIEPVKEVELAKENKSLPKDYKEIVEREERQKGINGAPENKMIDESPAKKTRKVKE
jgi:hypothetical protein